MNKPFAIVTGASSGIGYELAKCCVENGYDLLIAADEPEIHEAAVALLAATCPRESPPTFARGGSDEAWSDP